MHGNQRFFYCKHCGNLVGMLHSSGVPIICCGEPMTELQANTQEASLEKHVPDVKVEGRRVQVQVGSIPHPMGAEHHIAWVYMQTNKGGQRHMLTLDKEPVTEFALDDGEEPVAVYAYCNLHSLWKKSLE